MGFIEWLGFNNPRDAPKVPEVRDDVRDSGTLFVFGKANSGEQVDEKLIDDIFSRFCVGK